MPLLDKHFMSQTIAVIISHLPSCFLCVCVFLLIFGENSKPAADAKWYLNVRIVLTAYSCLRASFGMRPVIITLNLELV